MYIAHSNSFYFYPNLKNYIMEYHKIQSLFKRDMEAPGRPLVEGVWTLPEFEYLKDNNWVWTEKIDGTNIRIEYDGCESVDFKGRTDRAIIPQHLLKYLGETFHKNRFVDFTGEVVLYGEGYGQKIQKGHNYICDGVGFILFDIKIGSWWLERDAVQSLAVDVFNIPSVPIVGSGTLSEAVEFVRHGYTSLIADNKEYQAEGVVARPEVELFARNGKRIISKVKTRDLK